MQFKALVGYVTVLISAKEVEAFRKSWPCNNMKSGPIRCEFDRRNGNLADCWQVRGGRRCEIGADDDGSAVVALIGDARKFARMKGLL